MNRPGIYHFQPITFRALHNIGSLSQRSLAMAEPLSPFEANDPNSLINPNTAAYTWEEQYTRTWDSLQEDEHGSLQTLVEQRRQQAKKRKLRDTTPVQRGIIRNVMLMVELSGTSPLTGSILKKDLKPNRLDLTLELLRLFVVEFFDQNPLGQVGLALMRDGLAELVCELSGNTADILRCIGNRKNFELNGDASLQNGLELCRSVLDPLPSHGTREVLLIFSSLTTNDPGNIETTIEALKKSRVVVSIIGLSAEVRICKEICQETGGLYGVVLNEAHFKELVMDCIPPRAITEVKKAAQLIKMGFPSKIARHDQIDKESLCQCHNTPCRGGYRCPQCLAKVCSIPRECPICSITLISSPHLARSYHHLFPVPNFREVFEGSATHCFGCLAPLFSKILINNQLQTIPPIQHSSLQAVQCPQCDEVFCSECDVLIHDALHTCPGCSTEKKST